MINENFERSGRIWFRNALSERTIVNIERATAKDMQTASRHAADLDRILLDSTDLQTILTNFGTDPRPTQVVSFNKSDTQNWAIPWHQDRVVASDTRNDDPAYKNWTCKDGQWHCEPPITVLEAMVFVRIHLDNTTQDQGPMEIALGSHRLGEMPSADCKSEAERLPKESCITQRGDVLVLKMLTLHGSIAATRSLSRRTIRADYAFTN